jgi:hypothetical protein
MQSNHGYDTIAHTLCIVALHCALPFSNEEAKGVVASSLHPWSFQSMGLHPAELVLVIIGLQGALSAPNILNMSVCETYIGKPIATRVVPQFTTDVAKPPTQWNHIATNNI